MKKPWTMTAKAGGELEILLYEVIGEDFWTGDGITAKQFAEDLKAAGSVSRIRLRVNSSGGNVMDGLAMFNTLLAHPATVTAQVDGLAASIASVIIMSASQIDIGENALLMIHNPSTLVAGDSNEMRKMAETLDIVKSTMIRAYRRHSRKSEAEIAELMDAETWFSGSQAVAAGFADRVINNDESEDDVAAAVRAPIFAHFHHVPPRIAQIAARGGDDDRRRRSRLRRLEMIEMDLADRRRETMETRAQELRNMRAIPEPSEDLQRRRTLARMDRELREWKLDELAARGDGDIDEGRRRIQAERAREIASWQPRTLGGGYLIPLNPAETHCGVRDQRVSGWGVPA